MQRAGRLSDLLNRAERWQKPVFPLSGADVLAAGIAAGPKVGETLARLETEWLDRNFSTDRATLVARLQEIANG